MGVSDRNYSMLLLSGMLSMFLFGMVVMFGLGFSLRSMVEGIFGELAIGFLHGYVWSLVMAYYPPKLVLR